MRSFGLSLVVVAWSGLAVAQPSRTEKGVATALFEEGRALLAEGRVAEACPKLAESQRLDPGGGTLLNLALCHEKQGKLATALAEFQEALSWAVRDGRKDRAAAAEEHLAAIKPRLSVVVITLAPGAEAAGLDVTLDGVALGKAALGARLPLDPGEHEVVATSPGGRRVARTVHIDGEGTEARVILPAPDAAPSTSAPAVVSDTPRSPPPPREPPRRTSRAGVAALSLGVVATGVGVAFGLRARSLRADVRDACPDLSRCTAEGKARNDDALRAADVSTVVTSLGLAAIGVGVVLLVRGEAPQPGQPIVAGVRW